ncbi:uncharacterized protein LOC143239007 [Tachypleus tridentatus]|uniref:uncharacterized protein LOC143239007 n=1 Tax=Tachypleus tridentatus TaxID=6853 RepID=UPI003FD31ED5
MIRCRDRTAYFYIGDDDDYGGYQYNTGYGSNFSRNRIDGYSLRQSMSEPLLRISQYSIWHDIQEIGMNNRNESDQDREATFSQDVDSFCPTTEVSDDTLAVKNGVTLEKVCEDYTSCLTCGINWEDEQCSLFCDECGRYAMYRPCPGCDGQCGSRWRRDVAATHRDRWARWKGRCRLHSLRQPLFLDDEEGVTSDTENLKDDV